MATIGIYQIINILNNKGYIGSSIDINRRFKQHIHDLNHQKHHNSHLQNAWNKYGEKAFVFSIIYEFKHVEYLEKIESWFIEKSNYNSIYNLTRYAEGRVILTEEQKEKIREQWKNDIFREKCIKNITPALKGSNNINAKLTNDDVVNIIKRINKSDNISGIAKDYNVTTTVIYYIKSGKTWKDFTYLVDQSVKSKKRDYLPKPWAEDRKLKASYNRRLKVGTAENIKLTIEDVIDIKKRLNNGEKNSDISRIYNVGKSNISSIKRGLSWKDVTIK